MKNLRLHNVSIHRNFYKNRFINDYARKKTKSEGSHRVTEFFSEIQKNYVLNKKNKGTIQIKMLVLKRQLRILPIKLQIVQQQEFQANIFNLYAQQTWSILTDSLSEVFGRIKLHKNGSRNIYTCIFLPMKVISIKRSILQYCVSTEQYLA